MVLLDSASSMEHGPTNTHPRGIGVISVPRGLSIYREGPLNHEAEALQLLFAEPQPCLLASPAALTLEKPQVERSIQHLKSPFRSCREQKYSLFGYSHFASRENKTFKALSHTRSVPPRSTAKRVPCTCWDWNRFN